MLLVLPFLQVPDEFKQQAWNDLIRLTDEYSYGRMRAASVIGFIFSQVPDEYKQQAWNDLVRVINDKVRGVNSLASYVIGSVASVIDSVFSQFPDELKQQVCNDLHRLTTDKDSDVRSQAAGALGSVFSQVPDEFRQQAWNDLIRLATEELRNVSAFSNHSLGRVCIFKASQAETEEDYKKGLENAIEFFEIAAHESISSFCNPSSVYRFYNPSEFCLPFYRSFHTIIFKKQGESKEEINKYLKEAKYCN